MRYFTVKALKTLFLSTITAVMLAGISMAAEPSQAVAVGATTGSSLRLRDGASTSASVITTLDKNVTVAILGSANGWYNIAYNGVSGYVSADFLAIDGDNAFTTYGCVNATGVNVRSSASTSGQIVASVTTGNMVTVNGFENGWYKVTCQNGTTGYIRSDFVNLTATNTPTVSAGSNSRAVEIGKQHLGTRYVYGGASPSGFDCSGFTMYVYKQLGYSLPHSATSQWLSGMGTRVYNISALQPGDLVFFNDPSRSNGKACSHAGIYVGNGQMIHSSSSKNGVIYSNLNNGYYNTYFVGGIHI